MKCFITCFFLITSSFSYSQENSQDFEYQKLALGISPSSFLNLYSGVQVSFDSRLLKNLNTSLETAYIYKTPFSLKSQGYRIKLGLEYAYRRHPGQAFNIGFFGLYRNVFENRKFQVNHFEENYYESFHVKRNKKLIGGQFTFGFINQISTNIFMELGFGFGIGNLYVEDDKDVDNRNFFIFGFTNYDSVGTWNYPIVSFNINFFYQLFHFKQKAIPSENIIDHKIIK